MLTEVELASEVAAWLEADGWEVFHEVQPHGWQTRADLVATKDGVASKTVAVVETKLNLSFDLLGQAFTWKPYANAVWIAVPVAPMTDGRRMAFRISERYLGLGVLSVGGDPPVRVAAPASELSRLDDSLLMALRPEHKTMAKAGSPSGGPQSATGTTLRNFAAFVAANPQCSIAEAVDGIKHHYRTRDFAVTHLRKLVRAGKVPGVKFDWTKLLVAVGDPQ